MQLTAQNVDVLEEAVSRAERELDPSTIRKVFTAFPKLVSHYISSYCNYSIGHTS